jgi:hypothetical protein
LIVDNKEQPLGLFFSDINKTVVSQEGRIADYHNTTLRGLLNTKKLKHHVTGEERTTNGVKNYVILDITYRDCRTGI